MLMILDGWGLGEDYPGNAILRGNAPNFHRLWETQPHSRLDASGMAVGLPEGQMGNSEVGHTNIGAGRVVYQELTMLNLEIAQGRFFQNPVLCKAVDQAKEKGTVLHLLGLLSDGGVHSHIQHLFALLKLAKERGLTKVMLHCLLDGRDTDPQSGIGYMRELVAKCGELGVGQVATVCGRFYAMDRDKRWERVSRAYAALVDGVGCQIQDTVQGIEASYAQGVTDEFVEPFVCTDAAGKVLPRIQDGDSVIFFNFRSDRPRELCYALTDPAFQGFPRSNGRNPQTYFVTMTQYDENLGQVQVAYPPHSLQNTFGQVVSEAGLKQLRIAETEKYAHVTFFFNGGEEKEFPGEDRILIPSPKVTTYDLQPEMSAPQVCDAVLEQIEKQTYDVIILNFANTDMVGHTGVLQAAKDAVAAVDCCVGRIVEAVTAQGGNLLITADHGNAEQMLEGDNPMTAHTVNPVPFILVGPAAAGATLQDGRLEDICPTMLALMGLPQPAEMTGHNLWQKAGA